MPLRALKSLNARRIWSNWAGTVFSNAESFHLPESEEQVCELLAQLSPGKTVKVVGSGHSCSSIAAPTGAHLISLDRYNRLLRVDRKKNTVTVEGGIRLKDLNRALAMHGLALSNLGSISEQSVAGAISTATHGTGIRFGNLSQAVTELTLITARGEVLKASRKKNKDLYSAARVGLGCLGVISTVTLQCEPAFNLHMSAAPASWGDVMQSHREDCSGADHYGFWWFPHTDKMRVWKANRSEESPDVPIGRVKDWYRNIFLGNSAHEFALWLSSFLPETIPFMNRLFRRLLFDRAVERIADSVDIFNFPIRVKQWVMEYAVPIDRTEEALCELRGLIDRSGFNVHMPVEVRFTPADDAWLSPAWGRETCYIGIIMYKPYGMNIPYERYFRAFDTMMASFDGRPHWAKSHYRSSVDLSELYPKWGEFQELRKELDPDGVFMNDYLRRVFGEA